MTTDTYTHAGFMVRRSTKMTTSSPTVWAWIVRTTDGTFVGRVYAGTARAALAQWRELNVDD